MDRYSPFVTIIDKIEHSVLDAYRTCEFATLAKDGTPLTWPTSPLRQQDGTLLITTSIGFAQKALNVRRDGRVALLFSDPTGSGLSAPAQIFIAGNAQCSAEVTTSPAGLEDYWSMLYQRQPSSRAYVLPGVRSLMDWYYMRLLITVTPEHVIERPSGSATRPASALPAGSPELAGAWQRAEGAALPGARELAGYPSAVFAARDASGGIALARAVPQPADGGYLVAAAPDTDIVDGPASLLVHRHDDKLSKLKMALVRGRISRPGADADWFFTPGRVVNPADGPVRALRNVRAATTRYLSNRSLPRPAVPWDQYRALARRPTGGRQG
jgi:Pyridoxamine 5'-phosphate oxidase